MKHITSKLLSLLLCLAMLMSMVPAAYADVETEGASGKNTPTETNGGASEQDDAYDDAPDTAVVQSTAAATTDAAKVGETGYTTLADAIKAAKDGDTVTLLADRTEDVTITTSITLDLGGKTLTNTNAGKATLTVAAGATATVMNGNIVGGTGFYTIQNNGTATFENVTATAGNTGSSMIDNWGTLTIESGTYTGGLNVVKSEEGSTLTINGGKFTLNAAACKAYEYVAVVFTYGTTTITDGTFIQNYTKSDKRHPIVILTGVVEGYTSTTVVTGGTFTNNKSGESIFRGGGKATSDNFEVSGGTFNKSISDDYCADGFIPTKNADGTYGVKEGKYVAQIGSKKYETLADAIRLAAKGKTVTLLADTAEDITIAANKRITLDLNGKTLTNKAGHTITVEAGASLTITGEGTVDNVTHAKAAIVNYGTVVLNGGTYTRSQENAENNKDSAGGNSYYTILNDKGGHMTINADVTVTNVGHFSSMIRNGGDENSTKKSTLIINDGTFSGGINTVKNDEFGVLEIKGGNFSNTSQYVVMNWNEAAISGGTFEANTTAKAVLFTAKYLENRAVGELIVTGGTFKTTSDAQALIDDTYDANHVGTAAISGGSFSSAVLPKYCAPGFVSKDNGDGTYGVKVSPPVEVWTGYSLNSNSSRVACYETLAEAIENLNGNKWILIAKDYTLSENFTIPTDVRVDVKSGATLTVAENATLTVAAEAKRLAVLAGASIVNNGTIMVCGTSYSNGKVMIDGTLTGKLSVPEGYFLDNNENNYFATENSKALYEVTYIDGTVKKTADRSHVNENATQVKLLKDVEVGSWVLSNAADNFVLDLGGHTLSGSKSSGYYVLYAGVNMTIKNGTIKYNAGSEKGAICVYNGATVTIDSTATIDGGSGIGIMMQGETPSHVVLNGTVTTTGAYGFASNGSANSDGNPDTCNITVNAGATIEASKGFAIYHPTLGTVTVNGGTISGHTGIEMCAGKLVVKDGTITSTGANKDETGSQNAILDGAAISIINRNYPGGVPTAEITGGTIKATGTGMTVKAYDYKNDTVASWTDVSNYVDISGGTFSSIPDNMNALCAAGYIPFKNADGTYGVTRPSSGSSGSYDPTYSVSTPSKTENGSVTVSPKSASKGDTVTVTVKPDSGYVLETLTVTDKNGDELKLTDKGNGKYTFTMPGSKVEVKATFMEDNSVLNFFYDVPNGAYFYEAVKWAVKNGITTGVGNDLFAPEQPCTRAQIVTFLWRAAGSPEPKTASSFTDVPANAYYAKAVAWAVENGITNGMTATMFAPDATCTRGQSVTFLHRALKGSASGSTNFTDVASDAFYADAVNWAVANNVTNGTSNTTFSPNADCTRAEIVTFLYRAYQGK